MTQALIYLSPKKVLKILVSKSFCLRKFNFNLKLFWFVRILSPSKIVNMLQAIFFLWPLVCDIEHWNNWFSFVCFFFLVPSFIKMYKQCKSLVTILSTLFSFENYIICILSSHIILKKKTIVKDYLVNEALFSLFITSYIHPSLTCLH